MLKQSRNALSHLSKRYRAVLRRCRLRALALACALTALPPCPRGPTAAGRRGQIIMEIPPTSAQRPAAAAM